MNKRLLIVSLIIFVDVLGVGLILPLLPLFADQLGASPLVVGFFMSTFSFFAILSGPLLGALSDKYGRKPILLLSIAGTVLGFLLMGVAASLPLLFLARIIDGASAGNISTAKAAITDITSKEERVTSLGFTFAAESLGLIMGPVLGGLFSAYGFSVSAFIAAGIALVCLLLTLFFFTETRDFAAQPASEQKSASAGFHELLNVFRSANTRTFILVVFVLQLLIMMMWGTLALYGKALFGFTGQEIGYISAFAALVGISAQTGLLKVLTRVASEKHIITGAVLTMSAGMLLLAFSQTIAVLLVGVGLMAASFNVGMPTVVGLISKRSSENEQGSLMGSVSSVINLSSLTGPIFGTAIFGVSMQATYLVASLLGLAAAGMALASFQKEKTARAYTD